VAMAVDPDDDLVVIRPEGMYCPLGDFYIDPMRPVPRAVITHGHADHARYGMGCYHVAVEGLPILTWRLGEQDYRPHEYAEPFDLGGVRVSLHPAGHVLGSSQVRIEAGDRVWVASGDYKRQRDPTCSPFEVVPCETFITETTFGLPVYRWPDTHDVVREIAEWRKECGANGEAAILYCYALGKAQRVLAELQAIGETEPVWLHGAVDVGVQVYRTAGVQLPPTEKVAEAPKGVDFAGRLIIAPPSAGGSPWARRFRRVQQGFASGWMRLRGNRRRGNYDRGFVLSDHSDWPALLGTVNETGARRVIATHGNTDAFVRFLNEHGTVTSTFALHRDSED
jgi:putative mRNA 3-end processing factor